MNSPKNGLFIWLAEASLFNNNEIISKIIKYGYIIIMTIKGRFLYET